MGARRPGPLPGRCPTTRVDFDMSLEASPLKSTFRSTFDLSPQSARVAFNATFVPASANSVAVAVDYRITTGARNVAASGPLTVTRTPDGDSLSGTITVRIDGRGFATITFGGTGPTFQGPAGRPLTADELELLEQLYTVPQDILEAFENAVKPLELWFRTGERVAGLRG